MKVKKSKINNESGNKLNESFFICNGIAEIDIKLEPGDKPSPMSYEKN